MISVKAQGCTSSHMHTRCHVTVPTFTRMRSDSQASNNPTHAAYATLVAFSPQHGPGQLPALTPRVATPPSLRRSPAMACDIIPVKLDLRASTCEHRQSPRARSAPSVALSPWPRERRAVPCAQRPSQLDEARPQRRLRRGPTVPISRRSRADLVPISPRLALPCRCTYRLRLPALQLARQEHIGFESAPFKLTREWIDVMGGTASPWSGCSKPCLTPTLNLSPRPLPKPQPLTRKP